MSPYLEFVLLQAFLFSKITAGSNVCSSSVPDIDYVLTGHVIRTLKLKTFESCTFSCEIEPKCFSINYVSSQGTCELNRATKDFFPGDVVKQNGAFYLDMVVRQFHRDRDPCESMRCENGGTCVVSPTLKCNCPDGYTGLRCQNLQQLGMESGDIPNDHIESSTFLVDNQAWKGRLNGNSCWRPAQSKNTEHIKVTFVSEKTVFAIATQGSPDNNFWIESYTLQYFADGSLKDTKKVYQANKDGTSIAINKFSQALQNVKWIRIHPRAWHSYIALRLEVYGY
ncbi:lactadherin-like [Stylophora pistillata]|nr:lactadherin-like [Stylophora pistillata]